MNDQNFEKLIFSIEDFLLLNRSAFTYSLDMHKNQMDEEIGEFLVAFNHWKRGRADGSVDNIGEELADVIVCAIILILRLHLESVFQATVKYKMKRLILRLDDHDKSMKV